MENTPPPKEKISPQQMIDEAVAILNGSAAKPDELLKRAKALATEREIGYARRLLKMASNGLSKTGPYADIYLKIFQKSALYTYKDPDLPAEFRLDKALKILQSVENLSTTTDQESLGIAGAIHKRKWELTAQRELLERSLFYYLKGYAQGAPTPEGKKDILQYLRNNPEAILANEDHGYTGINAAYMLNLLAQHEEKEATKSGITAEAAVKRHADARAIREELIRSVPDHINHVSWLKDEWWFYATLGEANYGLGNYDQALIWLIKKPAEAKVQPAEWEYESSARQLVSLTLLLQNEQLPEAAFEQSPAGKALKTFLNEDAVALRSAFRGKFGLALSGGGFRASLYHIGVLARLAELDLLRHIEVLSCVSGGSIIGAHYYLEIRELFQSKSDDQIKQQDYIDIVKNIEKEFLAGVQRNIRTRVLAEFTTNVKMTFMPGYSRTSRVGELYEEEIFSRVNKKQKTYWLDELYIKPFLQNGTQQENFSPRKDNWRRKNKVPVLILNATSLNTGHIWQFTGSFMGEPPGPIQTDIDANYRLRRMYYRDAPDKYKKVSLGQAVAASSGVPAIFEPLQMDGLYPDISVRLVDGGVCDNQGATGLLEQDCSVLIVSDGSGQMEAENVPKVDLLGLKVVLRTNDISMARVREEEYADITARRKSGLLKGLLFVHLKQELWADPVTWSECPAHRKESDHERQNKAARDVAGYGIQIGTQKRLAAIRTDLDSFTDTEGYALMYSGYRMTKLQLENGCIEGVGPTVQKANWNFLSLAESLTQSGNNNKRINKLLDTSSSGAFKIWKQWGIDQAVKWILAILILAVVGWLLWKNKEEHIVPQLTYGHLWIILLGLIIMAIAGFVIKRILGKTYGNYFMKAVQWKSTLRFIIAGIGMCLFGWLIARLHLHVFDQFFLKKGKVRVP